MWYTARKRRRRRTASAATRRDRSPFAPSRAVDARSRGESSVRGSGLQTCWDAVGHGPCAGGIFPSAARMFAVPAFVGAQPRYENWASAGTRFARSLVVLELDPLAPRVPRLPHRRWGPLAQLTAAAALHVTLILIVAVLETTLPRGIAPRLTAPIPEVRHVVFLPSEMPRTPTGGGGGGNQRQDAIRRAQGVGADAITLRAGNRPAPTAPVAAPSAAAVEDVAPLPSILLDAKPLASGLFDQSGLPTGAVMSGTSTGPGSGGGVGTGYWDWHRLRTWPRIRPRIRRRNRRWCLPCWRGSIGSAPD